MKSPDLRLVLPVGLFVVVFAVMVVFVLRARPPAPVGVAGLDMIRDKGVLYLENEEIYVVATRESFIALTNDSQHVGDKVLYCPSSKMFASPAHGESFDRYGRYYGGPAASDMDRVESFVEGEIVYFDPTKVIETKNRSRSALEPDGSFCTQADPNNPGFFLAGD